jgi:hypothetical protein
MATKKTKKEEDMICTGESPFDNIPPMGYAMDVYQAYLQGMMNFWIAYSKLMTVPYYSQQVQSTAKKETVDINTLKSDSEDEDSE